MRIFQNYWRKIFVGLSGFLFLFVLVACESATSKGVVGVERKQILLLSSSQVENQAAEQYQEVLKEAQQQGKLNTKVQLTKRVQTIGNKLIPQVGTFRQDALQWKWEMNVIDSPELNAWCMPGGKIVFYSGIIEKLALTDDEIAAIMGHEIAHALREHSRERMSQQMASDLLVKGIDVVGQLYGVKGLGGISQYGVLLAMSLPNSREQERESDRIGIELAARAGYNPQGSVLLWQKMAQAGGGGGPEFLSTHPSSTSRQADLAEYAKIVQPLYQQSKR